MGIEMKMEKYPISSNRILLNRFDKNIWAEHFTKGCTFFLYFIINDQNENTHEFLIPQFTILRVEQTVGWGASFQNCNAKKHFAHPYTLAIG
jgi:hypothetical protein